MRPFRWWIVSGGAGGCRLAGEASEDRARCESGASGIVEVEEAADEFTGREETVDGSEIAVENPGGGVDAQTAKGERDAAGDGTEVGRVLTNEPS